MPASFNGFLFVVGGAARVGDDGTRLTEGQVGWLDRNGGEDPGGLRITAADAGARLLLYAGKPTGDPIVQHGPFVGNDRQDIARLYEEFRAGRFPKMSELGAGDASLLRSCGRNTLL